MRLLKVLDAIYSEKPTARKWLHDIRWFVLWLGFAEFIQEHKILTLLQIMAWAIGLATFTVLVKGIWIWLKSAKSIAKSA